MTGPVERQAYEQCCLVTESIGQYRVELDEPAFAEMAQGLLVGLARRLPAAKGSALNVSKSGDSNAGAKRKDFNFTADWSDVVLQSLQS